MFTRSATSVLRSTISLQQLLISPLLTQNKLDQTPPSMIPQYFCQSRIKIKKSPRQSVIHQLTQERGTDVLRDLIARLAGFAKVRQFFVEHPFEL